MAKISFAEYVSLATLAIVVVLLVVLVLSMTGTVTLCGSKNKAPAAASVGSSSMGSSSVGSSSVPPAVPISVSSRRAAGAANGHSAAGPSSSSAHSLLAMEAPEAVKAVRSGGRDKILYVLGQSSCPACVACKEYLTKQNYTDMALFVDLNKHAAMLKDGSLPEGVVKSLGRGVPCLVAYSHRSGAVMKKADGFSPKTVDEMVGLVRGSK